MTLKNTLAFLVSAGFLALGIQASGFGKVNSYSDDMFADVGTDAWYHSEVKSTYELGLMNGIGGGLFSPDGFVTVAEAITMASRANSVYLGENIPDIQSSEWYDKYVKKERNR